LKYFNSHLSSPKGEGIEKVLVLGIEKVLVLDDILELWKDAEKIHYNIAKEVAENKQIDKVLFCWVNYKDSFEKGLIDGWFKKENILNSLNNIEKKSVILFEGKKTKSYLNNLKK